MAHKLTKRTRLLTGIALGAAAMYLYDPELGGARRTRVRNKVRSEVRTAQREAEVQPPTLGDPRPATAPRPSVTPKIEGEVAPRPLVG